MSAVPRCRGFRRPRAWTLLAMARDASLALALLLFTTPRTALARAPLTNSAPISLPAFLAKAGQRAAPAVPVTEGYIGSRSCAECHKDEHASWHRSYHRTMTQRMATNTVLGRFDGAVVESGGYTYKLTHEDDTYWSEGPDPDQLMYWVQGRKQAPPARLPRVKLPVVMATGSHHYQTYWVPSPRHPGVLQTLPVVFLREGSQWIPREAAFLHGPEDPERFVTQWNHHCILCHSTGGNPGLDEASGQLRTQVAELGISCESCHGPAKAHVDLRRSLARDAKPAADPIVNPAKLPPARANEVCGQCHGVFIHRDEFAMEFARKGNLFRPGEPLEKTRHYPRHPGPHATGEAAEEFRRNPEFFARRWWPDGQMLAGGREYSAQRESACASKGAMSCLDCHSMHSGDPNDQLRPGRSGPEACVQCHKEPRYNADLAAHTHHPLGSSGSDCLNCHMPHTSYALFKAIRNHRVSSPRVAPVSDGGPPNACNLCHADRSLAWTREWMGKWYGTPPVPLAGAATNTSALAQWLLEGHAAQRVVAAWHLGWPPAMATGGGTWVQPLLAATLADDYGPVRFVAARSLRNQPGMGRLDYDFLAPPAQRTAAASRLMESLGQPRPSPQAPVQAERLQLPGGGTDMPRVREALARQDKRSITVSE